jgi:hypothetical protein
LRGGRLSCPDWFHDPLKCGKLQTNFWVLRAGRRRGGSKNRHAGWGALRVASWKGTKKTKAATPAGWPPSISGIMGIWLHGPSAARNVSARPPVGRNAVAVVTRNRRILTQTSRDIQTQFLYIHGQGRCAVRTTACAWAFLGPVFVALSPGEREVTTRCGGGGGSRFRRPGRGRVGTAPGASGRSHKSRAAGEHCLRQAPLPCRA